MADLTGLDGLPDRIAERSPTMTAALANPPGSLDARVVNSSAWRRAEIPAVNGHGTARGVAGLFAALGEGRLLSPAVTAALGAVAIRAVDHVLGDEAAWGLGVQIEADGFGMGGTGGSLGWWSSEGRYAIGFVTGYVADHDRVTRLDNAVRGCLGLPPL